MDPAENVTGRSTADPAAPVADPTAIAGVVRVPASKFCEKICAEMRRRMIANRMHRRLALMIFCFVIVPKFLPSVRIHLGYGNVNTILLLDIIIFYND